jgi:hypothetical protein
MSLTIAVVVTMLSFPLSEADPNVPVSSDEPLVGAGWFEPEHPHTSAAAMAIPLSPAK